MDMLAATIYSFIHEIFILRNLISCDAHVTHGSLFHFLYIFSLHTLHFYTIHLYINTMQFKYTAS